MFTLFRCLAHWPLGVLHVLGAILGWVTWACSPTYRRRIRENAAQAGYAFAQIRPCIAHAGRMAMELPRLWFGGPVPFEWEDQRGIIEAAFDQGRGVVFLAAHVGCFEIGPQTISDHFSVRYGPITILYREARQRWLTKLVDEARRRPGLLTAPATLQGVRQLIKALRAGQAVGLLPDQVPAFGQGVWSPMFGKPAYTMTLAARLIQKTGAVPLIAWSERLPRARGYRLRVLPFPGPLSGDLVTAVGQINAALEDLIRRCPQQYLWGYGRYKAPRGAPPGSGGSVR